MFMLVLGSVLSCLFVYVFGRAATLPLIRHYLPLKYSIGIAVLIVALIFLCRALRHNHPGLWGIAAALLGAGMGTLFLLFFCLFTVDTLTLFGFFLPRLAPIARGAALVIGVLLSAVALFQGIRAPVIKEYQVPLPHLPPKMNGKRIAAMTDMHLGTQLGVEWLAARIDQVQALNPDMIVLVGDILDGHDGTMAKLLPELRRLKAPMGVYAVLGNHEFYRGEKACTDLLTKAGITVLRNRWIQIDPGLILAGVDDLTTHHRSQPQAKLLSSALADRPTGGATILLSHTPWQAEEAARSGVGLMLSGHTHNGQIWPFNYLVQRIYPLMYGRYSIGGMTAIVCRGTGTWGPRMRLFHPGEILSIILEPPKK